MNQPATLTVGIAAEGNTGVVGVDVVAPKGFKLDVTPVENKSWTIERADGGSTLKFRGGRFAAGSCGFLLVRGTATSRGQKVMTVRTYDEDGTERGYGLWAVAAAAVVTSVLRRRRRRTTAAVSEGRYPGRPRSEAGRFGRP